MIDWFYELTGGRPMVDRKYYQTESERGKRGYRDRFGRHWMAGGPWSLTRVEAVVGYGSKVIESRDNGYCFIWAKRAK